MRVLVFVACAFLASVVALAIISPMIADVILPRQGAGQDADLKRDLDVLREARCSEAEAIMREELNKGKGHDDAADAVEKIMKATRPAYSREVEAIYVKHGRATPDWVVATK